MGDVVVGTCFSSRGFEFKDDGWHFLGRYICDSFCLLGAAVENNEPVGPLISCDGWLWAVPTSRTPLSRAPAVLSCAFTEMGIQISPDPGAAQKVWALLSDSQHDIKVVVPATFMSPTNVKVPMRDSLIATLKAANRAHERGAETISIAELLK